jgi:hypothetical protein
MKEKNRRLAVAAASVLVLGLVLAGCSGGGKTASKPATDPTPAATTTPTDTPEENQPTVDWDAGTITASDGSYTIASKELESGGKTLTKTVDLTLQQAASQMLQNGYVVEQEEVTTDAEGNVTQIQQTLAIDADSLDNEIKLMAAVAGIDISNSQEDGFRRMTMTYTYQKNEQTNKNELTNVTAAYTDNGTQYTAKYVPDENGKLTGSEGTGEAEDPEKEKTPLEKFLDVVANNESVVDKVADLSDKAQASAEEIKKTAEDYLTVRVLYSGTCGVNDGDNLTWELANNGTLTISGEGAMAYTSQWQEHRDEIKKVVVEEGVTSIAANAFVEYKLTSVELPASLTTIGKGAFMGNANLTTITVADGNTNYTVDGNVLFTSNKKTLVCYPAGLEAETYTVPGSVTCIGYSAFMCSTLKTITLQEGLQTIEEYAFLRCQNLTAIAIPATVTSVASDAFVNNAITTLTVAENNEYYMADGNVLFTKDKKTLVYYPVWLPATTYKVPDGVTGIGSYAFMFSQLKEITLPDSLTMIESYAFSGCGKLTKITLPRSVKTICENAFYRCTKDLVVTYAGTEDEWKSVTGNDGLTVEFAQAQPAEDAV